MIVIKMMTMMRITTGSQDIIKKYNILQGNIPLNADTIIMTNTTDIMNKAKVSIHFISFMYSMFLYFPAHKHV
jgi:hypothetical protein